MYRYVFYPNVCMDYGSSVIRLRKTWKIKIINFEFEMKWEDLLDVGRKKRIEIVVQCGRWTANIRLGCVRIEQTNGNNLFNLKSHNVSFSFLKTILSTGYTSKSVTCLNNAGIIFLFRRRNRHFLRKIDWLKSHIKYLFLFAYLI